MSTMAQGLPEGPQTRGRGQIAEGKYQPTRKEVGHWEEDIVSLAGLEGYEEE
jgi:hypothetical protein